MSKPVARPQSGGIIGSFATPSQKGHGAALRVPSTPWAHLTREADRPSAS
jgi:hypothetical protein